MSRLESEPITEQLELWDSEEVWPSAHTKKIQLPIKLATLRQKLYQKAKQEPKFRFYVLYDRIYRRDVLDSAYGIARANKGKAGVDGVSFGDIEGSPGGIRGFLDEIQESLRTRPTGRRRFAGRGYRNRMDVNVHWAYRPSGIGSYRRRCC